MTPVVIARDLVKTFSLGLIRLAPREPTRPQTTVQRLLARLPGGSTLHRQVTAVRGVSFEVRPNEIFGFLGPNGAGKTTTIKMLLGLIFPTRGTAEIFGRPTTDPQARTRVGFLPENPYLYQYLTALELLDLCGRLVGLDATTRRTRTHELVERLGLGHAADRAVRRYSKGMLQRLGLAQALLGDPDLLVLDEPMTGLDPIGRKEVRDLLLEEKKRGRTLFFSSHILSDVEMLCDRVAIMHRGELAAYGRLDELLRPEIRQVEIDLTNVDSPLHDRLAALGGRISEVQGHLLVTVEGEHSVDSVLDAARAGGARVIAVTPRRETLEDLFVRKALVTG